MIQWNEETLENENSVAQILMLADKEWNARKQLYERIRRKTDNSELVSINDDKIKVAFENYINSMVTGYFAGKAPVYDVEKISDPTKLNIIKKLFNKIFNIDANKDEELKQKFFDILEQSNNNIIFIGNVCMIDCFYVI